MSDTSDESKLPVVRSAAPAPVGPPPATKIKRGIRRHVIVGGLALAGLVFGLGGMAATIDFAGAIVTGGRLVVGSNVKKVQHPTGGTVAEIDVRDGDRVKAGEVIVRLDPTMAAANLGIVTKSFDELTAQKARLEAERDGLETLTFPQSLLSRADQPTVKEAMTIESGHFKSRLAAREGQKAQLQKKVAELNEQIRGFEAQEVAVQRQIDLTKKELDSLQSLEGKDLVPLDRLSAVGRAAAQLDGQLGQIISAKHQTGAEIAQAELQIIQIDADVKSEVGRELGEINSRLNEMTERKIAAEDQLAKLDIRAPQDGIVYQLAIHTVGGVVNPGEPIMLIVPANDTLVVEAQIDPNQVDRVHIGSEAGLRFTSFGSRDTPEYMSTVMTVSPDIVVDQRSGVGFYIARIPLPEVALVEIGKKLVPGMPVEVFIATDSRTVLSYLIKPLGDQILHTFRER